jgi:hypothetical protein
MTDQEAPEGPQERPEGGPAGLGPSEPLTGAQAGADSLGLREVIAGAIWDANSIHPSAIADAVYTRLKPHLAPHYQHAVDAAAAAERRAQQAEATVARVRALHQQEGDYCAICTEDYGRLSAPWPCPTIRALDGEQPASAPAASEATADACCGKPSGAVCVHNVAMPDRPKEQRERPTHPDGTPYRYHEINAEGWEHCDGCGLWGQWTIANPHECANDRVQPTDQPKEQ